MYGTLVDINTDEKKPVVWDSLTKFFEKNGFVVADLENKFFTAIEEVENSLDDYDIVDVFMSITNSSRDIAIEASRLYREKSINHINLFVRAKDLLLKLKEEKYNVYLLSNAQAVFTTLELKMLGIYDIFDKIFISSDYRVKKPNLEFYKLALEKTNSLPENSMMIGNDFVNDIAPARKLGMGTVFIYTENQTPYTTEKSDIDGFNYEGVLSLIKKHFNKK